MRADPDKTREWQRRSARKTAQNRRSRREPAVYDRQRIATQAAANGLCQAESMHAAGCDGYGTQAHHVQPRSKGGSDDRANLIWVHADCHARIHSRPNEAKTRGLLA